MASHVPKGLPRPLWPAVRTCAGDMSYHVDSGNRPEAKKLAISRAALVRPERFEGDESSRSC